MQKKKSRKIVLALFSRLPILRLSSVICLAVFRLPGDGVRLAPGLTLGQVHFALSLLRCPADAASDEADLHLADRCHSLSSLHLPQAALASLPFLESFS